MWGIEMPTIFKSGAPIIMSLISLLGKMETYAPTTNSETRILQEDYKTNKLTNDLHNFRLLGRQVEQYPDLQIGGPSTAWISAALDEIEFQIGSKPPSTPALCFLAEEEEIIDSLAVRTFCDSWYTCDLIYIPKAKHDLLMEQNSILAALLSKLDEFIKNN
jgi:lysophospholipase